MKTLCTPARAQLPLPGEPGLRRARTLRRLLTSVVVFGVALAGALAASAQPPAEPHAVDRKAADKKPADKKAVEPNLLDGVTIDLPADAQPTPDGGAADAAAVADTTEPATDVRSDAPELHSDPGPLPETPVSDGTLTQPDLADPSLAPPPRGRLAEWLEPLRVSLKHELSYKVASPQRLVNDRSSVRVEYSKLVAPKLYVRLDTKLNLYWFNDHRAKARDADLFREPATREAYLQTSLGKTSVRLGYQILPWGVSEGGAITDEVSPRNTSEFFFVSLEESRIGQPMLTADHFSDLGQWTAFFVPRPSYNKYPDQRSAYDIPGAFDVPRPRARWNAPGDYEYGLRWQRTFGKSDLSLMTASLIDNDYVVRKQRFSMFGLTANVAKQNLLFRAEAALKKPKALFARATNGDGTTIVESDQLDASLGFSYTPGGRSLVYSAEVVWNRLLDWRDGILGRVKNEYSLIGAVGNRFHNDELTLTWLTIYNQTYKSVQSKFLSSYRIDDNSTVYLEVFYPIERDDRSASWPYRDQKQLVIRYQYQF